LCLHVLKIWRHPDLGYVPGQIRAKLAAGRTPQFDFAKIVPVSIEIELPGGRAEMQIYAGGSQDESTRADMLAEKGDRLFDNSQLQEAIAAYEEALGENPNHTHALANLAAARARLDDLAGAYYVVAQATSIEPNYPLYRRALIQYLAAQGLARLALDDFRAARENFPNLFNFDDLGAELFLVCG
jgi:tetratricopeptide (TPR) repeat protein